MKSKNIIYIYLNTLLLQRKPILIRYAKQACFRKQFDLSSDLLHIRVVCLYEGSKI